MTGEGSPAEIIRAALTAEREASLFYRMLAELVPEGTASERLVRLAQDEEGHARVLNDLNAVLAGPQSGDSTSPHPEGDPTLFDFSSRSLADVLRFALHNEERSERLYRAQCEQATDPETADIWRMLADAEQAHAAALRLQIRQLG